MPCVLPAEGGVLYTWGGDFTWAEPADVRAAWAAAAAEQVRVSLSKGRASMCFSSSTISSTTCMSFSCCLLSWRILKAGLKRGR